jgi:hypothetical protein
MSGVRATDFQLRKVTPSVTLRDRIACRSLQATLAIGAKWL